MKHLSFYIFTAVIAIILCSILFVSRSGQSSPQEYDDRSFATCIDIYGEKKTFRGNKDAFYISTDGNLYIDSNGRTFVYPSYSCNANFKK